MNYEFLLQIIVALGSLVAMYATLKADLVKAIHKAESAENRADKADENATECHARLDRHLEVKH